MFLSIRRTLVAFSIACLLLPAAGGVQAASPRVEEAKAALRQVNRTAHQTKRTVKVRVSSKAVQKAAAAKSTPQQVRTKQKRVSQKLLARASKRTPQARVTRQAVATATVVAAPAVMSSRAAPSPVVMADALKLRSNVAYVIDAQTREVLVSKNDDEVLPIASLTKLMTALVIHDQGLDMEQLITITDDDVDRLKGSRSRLRVGSKLTRGELMHLALMSSENRAAHALGRTFPGGLNAFVANMNAKAALLGMTSTHYVEPTGLSSDNRSSARDLALLVGVAATRPMLRDLSTDEGAMVRAKNRDLAYRNTNALVRSDDWDIDLQKTGYIREAGRCLVMKAKVADRPLIMIFLDSEGKYTRLGDANRVRKWLESEPRANHASSAYASHS